MSRARRRSPAKSGAPAAPGAEPPIPERPTPEPPTPEPPTPGPTDPAATTGAPRASPADRTEAQAGAARQESPPQATAAGQPRRERPREERRAAPLDGPRIGLAANQASLWLFIAILAWAPAPLASNIAWAWSVLTLLTGAALALWTASMALTGARLASPLRPIRTSAICLALVCLWILVQWSPLTPTAWHDPHWAAAREIAGVSAPGRMTVNPYRTLTGLLNLLTYAGAFWLAYQFGADRGRAMLVLRSAAVIGLAYAAYGLAVTFAGLPQVGFWPKTAYLDSLTSTFVNRNSYATYAGFGAIVSLVLVLWGLKDAGRGAEDTRRRLARLVEAGSGRLAVYAIAALATTSALLLTDSRAGLASAAIGAATMLALTGAARRANAWPALAAGLGLVVIGGALFGLSGGGAADRAAATAEDFATRVSVYEITAQMIADAPLTGVGYGAFADAFPEYRDGYAGHLFVYDKAHNTYLQTIAELGWPAAILMILAAASAVAACVRGMFARQRDREFCAAATGVAVLAGAHALVDFSLQIPAVAYTFSAILGVGVAQSFSRSPGTRRRRRIGR